jgi:hypothetical protein
MSTPPPTFEDRAKLGSDPVWRSRCEVAGLQAAANVMSESTAAPGHEQRAAQAYKFLNSPASMSGPLAMAVAAQPGITGPDAVDNDILFTVNALWSSWSGYSPNP